MTNPRSIILTTDDRLWIYDAMTSEDKIIGDPTAWFDSHISGQLGEGISCQRRPDQVMRVIQTRPSNDLPSTQYVGVCGTRVILETGFPVPAPELNGEGMSTNQSETSSQFWLDFEERLNNQGNRNGEIEFLFLVEEELLYIHLELGNNPSFASTYIDNIQDKIGFRNWLLTGSLITRSFKRVFPDGSQADLPNINVGNINIDVSGPIETDCGDDLPPCPIGYCYRSCNLISARITSFDELTGSTVNCESTIVKPYCDDSHGLPCPPITED